MNLSALQAEARLQSDMRATKTIAITVAAYFISYVPVILYAVLGQQDENLADSWFAFIAWYAMFFSSAVNPFTYYLQTSRIRSAFKQLIKDPFGSSDFKEKLSSRNKGRGKGNFNRAVSGKGNQAMYRGERKNGIMVLSTAALQAQMYVLEVGANSIDGGGNPGVRNTVSLISSTLYYPGNASLFSPVIEFGDYCAEEKRILTMKATKKEPCKETEAITFDENKDASKKSVIENEPGKGKRPSASIRKKVHPLDTADSLEFGNQAQKKVEVLAHN